MTLTIEGLTDVINDAILALVAVKTELKESYATNKRQREALELIAKSECLYCSGHAYATAALEEECP